MSNSKRLWIAALALGLLAAFPAESQATIAYVTSTYTNNSSAGTTLTFYKVATGAGHDLVVTIDLAGTTASVSSITSSFESFTKCAAVANTDDAELWYAHSIGGNSQDIITVTLSASVFGVATLEEYSGVNGEGACSAANAASGTGTSASVTETVSSGDWLVAGFGHPKSCCGQDAAGAGTLRQGALTNTGGDASTVIDNTGGTSVTVTDNFNGGNSYAYGLVWIDLQAGGAAPAVQHTLPLMGCCQAMSGSQSSPAILPPGIVGQFYSITLAPGSGAPPFVESITKGALPPGLQIEADLWAIDGFPTQPGQFEFGLQIADAASDIVTAYYLLPIDVALDVADLNDCVPSVRTLCGVVEAFDEASGALSLVAQWW